jgi:hypothetical protein
LDFVDVEAAMAPSPGRSDARSLVITGKAAAADGLAVLTLARPAGGRLPRAAASPARRAVARMRYRIVITRYHAVITDAHACY